MLRFAVDNFKEKLKKMFSLLPSSKSWLGEGFQGISSHEKEEKEDLKLRNDGLVPNPL
jgi:hypothetical protein